MGVLSDRERMVQGKVIKELMGEKMEAVLAGLDDLDLQALMNACALEKHRIKSHHGRLSCHHIWEYVDCQLQN